MNGHEIVRVLGEGGMGEVYIARHQQLGTVHALEVTHDDIKSNPSIAKRFAGIVGNDASLHAQRAQQGTGHAR